VDVNNPAYDAATGDKTVFTGGFVGGDIAGGGTVTFTDGGVGAGTAAGFGVGVGVGAGAGFGVGVGAGFDVGAGEVLFGIYLYITNLYFLICNYK